MRREKLHITGLSALMIAVGCCFSASAGTAAVFLIAFTVLTILSLGGSAAVRRAAGRFLTGQEMNAALLLNLLLIVLATISALFLAPKTFLPDGIPSETMAMTLAAAGSVATGSIAEYMYADGEAKKAFLTEAVYGIAALLAIKGMKDVLPAQIAVFCGIPLAALALYAARKQKRGMRFRLRMLAEQCISCLHMVIYPLLAVTFGGGMWTTRQDSTFAWIPILCFSIGLIVDRWFTDLYRRDSSESRRAQCLYSVLMTAVFAARCAVFFLTPQNAALMSRIDTGTAWIAAAVIASQLRCSAFEPASIAPFVLSTPVLLLTVFLPDAPLGVVLTAAAAVLMLPAAIPGWAELNRANRAKKIRAQAKQRAQMPR